MAKTPETLFTNREIADAFSTASNEAGIVLPDGSRLKIVGKSVKSTWSKNPNSFETDTDAKTKGPHENSRVLWTPSVDLTDPRWSVRPEDTNDSALVKVMGGSLQILARSLNTAYRETSAISKDFAAQKASSRIDLANAVVNGDVIDIEEQASLLVVAAIPEATISAKNHARLQEQGVVFLENIINVGNTALEGLLAD